MGLIKRAKHNYGTSQADIPAELLRYSNLVGYPAAHFADAMCRCGGKQLRLELDDAVGAAVRTCPAGGVRHPLGDGDEYLDDAELGECACPCGEAVFEITIGVSLYDGSEDVRWLDLGCRCPRCGLTACYGDWKNEFDGFKELLNRI